MVKAAIALYLPSRHRSRTRPPKTNTVKRNSPAHLASSHRALSLNHPHILLLSLVPPLLKWLRAGLRFVSTALWRRALCWSREDCLREAALEKTSILQSSAALQRLQADFL